MSFGRSAPLSALQRLWANVPSKKRKIDGAEGEGEGQAVQPVVPAAAAEQAEADAEDDRSSENEIEEVPNPTVF
jgi:hypothetical protein